MSTSSRARRRGTASANTRGSRSPDCGTRKSSGQWSIYWRTATSGSTSTNASGRPRTNIRSLLVLVLRWSRIGTTDVSPTTAPKNFVSEFVKARSGACALGGAPSNPSLSTIPADRHSDSATFRDNPSYHATPRTLRTRFDRPVHFSSTFSYTEHALIVNRGGDGRDAGALRGVP